MRACYVDRVEYFAIQQEVMEMHGVGFDVDKHFSQSRNESLFRWFGRPERKHSAAMKVAG